MTIDNLLLLAFTNNWYALQNLLQHHTVVVKKSDRESTIIEVSNSTLANLPDFFSDMDDSNIVYLSQQMGRNTYIKIYHK